MRLGGVSTREVPSSRGIGGAALQEEGVAGVADSDWFRRGGQRKLIVRAAVAEDLPAVSAVMLPSRDGELLLTQLTVAGILVLQPNLSPLKSFVGLFDVFDLQLGFSQLGAQLLQSLFLIFTDALQLNVFIMEAMKLLLQATDLQGLGAQLGHAVALPLQVALQRLPPLLLDLQVRLQLLELALSVLDLPLQAVGLVGEVRFEAAGSLLGRHAVSLGVL